MTAHRNPMVAKIHIAQAQLGLDDAAYRALLVRITGRDSSKGMTAAQLDAVLAEFKRLGWKPVAARRTATAPSPNDDVAAKVRALWIAAHHLGAVQDGSESALRAFVQRQAKVDDVRFLRPGQAHKVIEALKAMAVRAGVNWAEPAPPLVGTDGPRVASSRCCVIRGQWRRLRQLGALTVPEAADDDALSAWLHKIAGRKVHWAQISDDVADRAITRLGTWIRTAIAKRVEGPGR